MAIVLFIAHSMLCRQSQHSFNKIIMTTNIDDWSWLWCNFNNALTLALEAEEPLKFDVIIVR